MKSYTIEVNHQDKLIYRKFFGDIVFDEIKDSWNEVLNLPEFNDKNYHLISDYTNSTIQVSASSMPKVQDFYKKIGSKYEQKRHAVMVSKPRQTAFSKLFKQKYNDDGILFNIFEDKDSAIRWIKNETN